MVVEEERDVFDREGMIARLRFGRGEEREKFPELERFSYHLGYAPVPSVDAIFGSAWRFLVAHPLCQSDPIWPLASGSLAAPPPRLQLQRFYEGKSLRREGGINSIRRFKFVLINAPWRHGSLEAGNRDNFSMFPCERIHLVKAVVAMV